ncbi:MAG TPA: hypothetical protein VE173_15735, partial [Longimicrobiales bacterium]|nr:hypothetical protein [Longimicrobiales bacterium]
MRARVGRGGSIGARVRGSWPWYGVRALAAAGVILYACGGDGPTDPPGGPTPGILDVRLTVPVGADDGAVRLELAGPAIQEVRAGGSLELFEGGSTTRRTVILVGALRSGTVLRVQVADVDRASAYSARVL